MAATAEPAMADAAAATATADGTAAPTMRTVHFWQCTPCFRYRARCQAARPCLRCIERHQEQLCEDVGPPCIPCIEKQIHCDRRRPCKKCKEEAAETGGDTSKCVDGPPDEKRSEVVEVGPDGLPIPVVRPEPAARAVGAPMPKPGRKMTEGERLQWEMEASDAKRRKSQRESDDDGIDDSALHSREKEQRREDLIRHHHTARPHPTHPLLPLLPPPPAAVPALHLLVHWPDPLDSEDVWALDDDEDDGVAEDSGPVVGEEKDAGDASTFSPHFLTDFSHLIPRPPLLPLSGSPVAFLNLWAHFMHVQRRPITGHHIVVQQRSITAWDVYRVVTEHGGYHHVLTHRLFHSVLSNLCHSSQPATAQVLATTLPGGPPVAVAVLRPRTFLIDYYERFLYAFEVAYQWEKGCAPAIVPQPGRTVASVVEGKRRKRKAAGGIRVDLLKRLWAPSYHAHLFKERENQDDPSAARDEDQLGYVGVTRLKRSLASGVTEEVTAAVNRLLRLSWAVAKKAGGWEEDEADDDEDATDACLLFYHDVISDLLGLLLHPPLHRPHLTGQSASPALTPLLVHEHLLNVASSAPDYHTAVLVILHNVALHQLNHHRLAAHTTALNLLAHIVMAPQTALLHADVDESWTLSLRALTSCLPSVNLLHIVRRYELLSALITVLQDFLDRALFPDDHAGEDDEDAQLAAAVLSGLTGLLTNPHHASNIPFLVSALPSAFFSLLLSLASPLCPALVVRQLAMHALTFFTLSHRAFASRLVRVRGLQLLLSFLCSSPKDAAKETEADREMRRAAAAAVQAIASYCTVQGGEESSKDGLRWELIWKYEAELFTACCLDPDVGALLVPALQRSQQTRKQAAEATAAQTKRTAASQR